MSDLIRREIVLALGMIRSFWGCTTEDIIEATGEALAIIEINQEDEGDTLPLIQRLTELGVYDAPPVVLVNPKGWDKVEV